MLNTIAHWLEMVPGSFWGVVAGSFFSILSVFLTNRANDKRLRVQLENERLSKTKDREMALRKEVFLSAAEAVSAGINSIDRFANLDMPNDQVTQPYVEKAPAISKVHVIARTETILPLIKFTGRLESRYIELFAKRHVLMNEKNVLTRLAEQIAKFGQERDRILELKKQHNIESILDDRRWETPQKNLDFEQKQISEMRAHGLQLANNLERRRLEFMRECVLYTEELSEMLTPVLTAVRVELELRLDEAAYRQAMSESHDQQKQAIDEYIQKFMPNTA